MAIVQISKIQIRTGDQSDLPQLDIGELGFATDTQNVYIGNDPILYPPVGSNTTLTQILTDSANCYINASQLVGNIIVSTLDNRVNNISVPIANLKITGGFNGQVLTTDGAGNLSFSTVSGGGGAGTPGGLKNQIQINAGNGNFTANSYFTFDPATLTATLGNLANANYFSGNFIGNAGGLSNIQGANVIGSVPNANDSAYLGGVIATNYLQINGDGSGLTNITGANVSGFVPNATHATIADTANSVHGGVVTGTVSNANNANYLGGVTASNYLQINGNGSQLTGILGSGVTGFVPAATVANTVTASNQPNITAVGNLLNLTVTGVITAGNVTSAGNITAANIGNVSTKLYGNGINITNIAGANVSGVVQSATYALNLLAGGSIGSNVVAVTQPILDKSTKVATTALVRLVAESLYPVGSIYVNAMINTNPNTLFGFGTWVAYGTGQVLVGVDGSNPLFASAGSTGGSADAIVVEHTHTASSTSTVSETPHSHYIGTQDSTANDGGSAGNQEFARNYDAGAGAKAHTNPVATGLSVDTTTTVNLAGSSGTNQNLQPYVVVYIWKRTA